MAHPRPTRRPTSRPTTRPTSRRTRAGGAAAWARLVTLPRRDGHTRADVRRPGCVRGLGAEGVRTLRMQWQHRLLRFLHDGLAVPASEQLCRTVLRTEEQRVVVRAIVRVRVAALRGFCL